MPTLMRTLSTPPLSCSLTVPVPSYSRRFRQPVTKDVRAESRCRTSCQHRQYFSLEKKVEPFSEAPFGLRLIGPPDVVSPMCHGGEAKPALTAMEKRVGD